ncbi:hypothetical protein F511_09593 [Dorcoceras hygrometricum]|uniref:RRM domain-containing protein n=1 Tax=Dorcoceras hygrometricum TaxID=472368 RepID=A0A2Z7CST0_9LAMI|nr:hypothetical protein F511_09593 [Dorcoceras hygrometricum]
MQVILVVKFNFAFDFLVVLDVVLFLNFLMQTRTVQVKRLSDLATEREIHEFFSFSGEIERVEIRREPGQSKTAFVTFKDARALEIALLLSGATIVDQVVSITTAETYVPRPDIEEVRIADNDVSISQDSTSPVAEVIHYTTLVRTLHGMLVVRMYANMALALIVQFLFGGVDYGKMSPNNGRVYVTKAQDVVSSMLAKGSAMRQDAVNKAKAFDEKHRLTANASARVISFDRRVGLSEKFTVGISVVNEKVKSVDQRFQVSDKTTAALMAAERKLNDTGSAVKSSRYVAAGTTWLNGAFNKVAKAGQVAGVKTRERWNVAISNLTAKVHSSPTFTL